MTIEINPDFEQRRRVFNPLLKIQDIMVRLTGNELGTEPTGSSRHGWRVCYPVFDPSVRYEPTGTPFTTSSGGGHLVFNNIEEELRRTYIIICSRFGRPSLRITRFPTEEYYLRREQTGIIDSRAVMYFHPRVDRVFYTGFSPSEYRGRILVTPLRRIEGSEEHIELPPSIEEFLKELTDR